MQMEARLCELLDGTTGFPKLFKFHSDSCHPKIVQNFRRKAALVTDKSILTDSMKTLELKFPPDFEELLEENNIHEDYKTIRS